MTKRIAGAAGAAILFAAIPAVGAPDPAARAAKAAQAACFAAYERGQQQENEGHLIEARDSMTACAKAACGDVTQRACLAAYTRLDMDDIPSVVLRVVDETGSPLVDVAVTVDGRVLATHLDGRGISLDPGLHEFSFRVNGQTFGVQRVMVGEGQHNHIVSAVFRPAAVVVGPAVHRGAASPAIPAAPAARATPATPATAATEATAAPVATADAGAPARAERRAKDAPSAVPFVFAAAGVLGLTGSAFAGSFGKADDATSVAIDASIGVGVAAAVIAIWFIANKDTPPRRSNEAITVSVQGSAPAIFSGVF